MNRKVLLYGVALAAAAALAVFGDSTPQTEVAEAVVREAPARSAAPAPRAAPESGEPAIVRLKPRAMLIGDSDDAIGAGENVFQSQDWNPPPPKVTAVAAPPPPPPPPPSAPPLPFTYLGKAVGEGAWEVYLARADKTYIVRNKMVIDGIYRVDTIAPPTLTLTYLPLNQVQQLNIGVLD